MDYVKYKAIEEGLAGFSHCCHCKTYPAKSILIRLGDPTETLFYIREGIRFYHDGK